MLDRLDARGEALEPWNDFHAIDPKATRESVGWCGLRRCEPDGSTHQRAGYVSSLERCGSARDERNAEARSL